jgi:hypothetical protein
MNPDIKHLDMKKTFFIALLLFSALLSSGQDEKDKNKMTDKEIRIVCPLENGTGREAKDAYYWDPPEHKVIIISQTDSIVRAGVPGDVVTVQVNEDNLYEIVIYYKEHYFWYNNVTKSHVRRLQKVTASQTIGTYTPGVEVELRVYKEPKKEDPIMLDPRDMLDCRKPEEKKAF